MCWVYKPLPCSLLPLMYNIFLFPRCSSWLAHSGVLTISVLLFNKWPYYIHHKYNKNNFDHISEKAPCCHNPLINPSTLPSLCIPTNRHIHIQIWCSVAGDQSVLAVICFTQFYDFNNDLLMLVKAEWRLANGKYLEGKKIYRQGSRWRITPKGQYLVQYPKTRRFRVSFYIPADGWWNIFEPTVRSVYGSSHSVKFSTTNQLYRD